jgi:hypothetical protein
MFVLMLFISAALAQVHPQEQSKAWHTAPPVAWGQLIDGWQLALFAEKQSYFYGEPVTVALVGRNGNPAPLGVSVPNSNWRLADFEIRRMSDRKVMMQRPPKDTRERMLRWGTSVRERQVKPGATTRFGVVDLRMYDLTPGTYTISATIKFPNPANKAQVPVRSNEITVSIIAR